jgi:pimeloyl-ACP methyl ester carboxylesterase
MKKAYVDVPEGQIHYRSEGEGEPLLLFHQAPMSSVEWEEVMPLLSPHFRVIAPDMLGHGNSDDPPREFEMADFTRTTLQFMDALGIQRASVGGNHSGAALAMSLAVHHPERVSRLAMSCEMLVTPRQIEDFLAAMKGRPMSRDLPMTADGSFLAEAWDRYRALGPTAPLAVRFKAFVIGQAARQRPYDAHYPVLRWMAEADHLARVRCPTLIFGAEHDLFFNADTLAAAPQRLPGCKTAVIHDAGALSVFEKPREVAQALLGFLRG